MTVHCSTFQETPQAPRRGHSLLWIELERINRCRYRRGRTTIRAFLQTEIKSPSGRVRTARSGFMTLKEAAPLAVSFLKEGVLLPFGLQMAGALRLHGIAEATVACSRYRPREGPLNV